MQSVHGDPQAALIVEQHPAQAKQRQHNQQWYGPGSFEMWEIDVVSIMKEDFSEKDKDRSKCGWLPKMATCSKRSIGSLLESSFCERINSCADQILTLGNTLLGDGEMEKISHVSWLAHKDAEFQRAGTSPEFHWIWLQYCFVYLIFSLDTWCMNGKHAQHLFVFFQEASPNLHVAPGMPVQSPVLLQTDCHGVVSNFLRLGTQKWYYQSWDIVAPSYLLDAHYMLFVEYTKILCTPILGLWMLLVVFFACEGTQNMPANTTRAHSALEQCVYIYHQFIQNVQYGLTRCSELILKTMLLYDGLQATAACAVVLVTTLECCSTFARSDEMPWGTQTASVRTLTGPLDGHLFNMFNSSQFTVVALSEGEKSHMMRPKLLAARVVLELLMLFNTMYNLSLLPMYVMVCRCATLVVLVNPTPAAFLHFMDWNVTHMLVVWFSNNGFTMTGLYDIVLGSLHSLVFYAVFSVIWMLNLVLYLLRYIRFVVSIYNQVVSGDWTYVAAEGASQSVWEWIQGTTISAAVVVLFLVVQHRGPFCQEFSWYLRQSFFPWQFFLPQSNMLYLQTACAGA